MKRIILTTLFIVLINYLFAQKEGNMWYFGDSAGIDFNSGTPVALNNSSMNQDEGCASTCDCKGQILFYTGGTNVYDRTHAIMPNGTGLMGHMSATQSALIIPKPGSNNIYYIFTVDCAENGFAQGLRYSEVDMTLNGGLGDITPTKNILLASSVTEKLVAAKQSNGVDLWVLVHEWNSDVFHAYSVTSSGINIAPVISKTGAFLGGGNAGGTGYMKVSPDGSKLAIVVTSIGQIELFDFNNNTGVVSNPITFPLSYGSTYGVEFSPDNSKLYVSNLTGAQIYQFNLQAGSSANIIASATHVGTVSGTFIGAGAMQIGPDGKIYIAKIVSSYVSVINNPNSLGIACGFVDNGVNLGTGLCSAGLPLLMTYFSNCDSLNFSFINTCFGDSTIFIISDTSNIDSVLWNFDDISGTSTFLNPFHIFSSPGVYDVKLICYKGVNVDTIIRQVTIYSAPTIVTDVVTDTTICENTSVTFAISSIGDSLTYQWYFNNNIITGATDSFYTINSATTNDAGNYYCMVSNFCGSDTSNIAVLNVLNPPAITIQPNNQAVCEGDSVTFTILATGDSIITYQWYFNGNLIIGATDSFYTIDPVTINDAGNYYCIVNNICGNDTSSVVILSVSKPSPPIVSDITVCKNKDGILTITNPDTVYTYEWYDSLSGGTLLHTGTFYQVINVTNTLTYYVQCKDTNGCISERIPVIVYLGIEPIADFVADTVAYEKQQTQFTDNSQNANKWHWYWGDGQTSTNKNPKHSYDVEGIYTIMLVVTSIDGCEDTIVKTIHITKKVEIYVPTTFTPNGDGKNDILYVKGEGIETLIMKIYNQWGILLFESTSQNKGWNGKYNDKEQSEGNYVYVIKVTTIDNQEFSQQGVVTIVK